MTSGAALLLPVPFSLAAGDGAVLAFVLPSMVFFLLGGLLARAGREHPERVLVREGAYFLVGAWLVLTAAAMLPYMLSGILPFLDALSEGVSGITTTRLTLLPADAPRSLVFWRSLTQWLGGLYIIFLLVTVMPQTSAWFGMALVMPRGISTGRLLPSMRRLAWRVGRVYIWATAVFAAVFAGLGLSTFDALNLSMVTLATGGCYDAAPLGGTRGVLLSFALMAAMLFASGNFFFYAETIRRRSFSESDGANEMKAVLRLVAVAGLIVSMHLWKNGVYGFWESLRQGFFATAAFLSTTGTSPEMFAWWPDFDRFLLLLLAFIGGSIASSAGGLKILRVMVLAKAARQELVRTLHPRMVFRVEVLNRVVPNAMVGYLLAFFALYVGSFFGGAILFSAMGIELLSAMGLSVACLTSAGPVALLVGDAGLYTAIGESGRMVCAALMLLGRLEIFSFLFVLQTFLGRWKGRW